ncbi:hypothetical protein [Mariniflexile sp. HMF6888]|uniref:hypothetical protein n=1 Tax=Mariniflexile sp. HMF6888 TaxID=3373086 RepID=UPI00378B185A
MGQIVECLNKVRNLLKDKISEKSEAIDLVVLLHLDVILFEIMKNNEISNQTAEAMTQIAAFQSIEYYYHEGYLELDKELKELGYILGDYNEKYRKHELGVIGTKPENWGNYFKERVETLLNNWEV